MIVKKYEVLSASNKANLVTIVNDWIGRGWTPQGGVIVIPSGIEELPDFAQAMVLYEK